MGQGRVLGGVRAASYVQDDDEWKENSGEYDESRLDGSMPVTMDDEDRAIASSHFQQNAPGLFLFCFCFCFVFVFDDFGHCYVKSLELLLLLILSLQCPLLLITMNPFLIHLPNPPSPTVFKEYVYTVAQHHQHEPAAEDIADWLDHCGVLSFFPSLNPPPSCLFDRPLKQSLGKTIINLSFLFLFSFPFSLLFSSLSLRINTKIGGPIKMKRG